MFDPNHFLAMAAWHTLTDNKTADSSRSGLERERTGDRPERELQRQIQAKARRKALLNLTAGKAKAIGRVNGDLLQRLTLRGLRTLRERPRSQPMPKSA